MGNICKGKRASPSIPRECTVCLLIFKCYLCCGSSVVTIAGCSFLFYYIHGVLLCQKVKARPWTLAGLRPSGSHSKGRCQGWRRPGSRPQPRFPRPGQKALSPCTQDLILSKYRSSVMPVSCSIIALYLGKWTVGLLLKRLETPAWILLANEHFTSPGRWWTGIDHFL